MKFVVAILFSLLTLTVAFHATDALALEDFSFGVPSESPEVTKMEFEQWLRQRLMSAMTPFLSNSKILITVKVSLRPEVKPKTKKADVFLSKFDTRDVLEYDPKAQEHKPKTFLERVKKIEIALAHDGSLSDETVANLKTLAGSLVAGVPSSRVKITALALAPVKVDPPADLQREVATAQSPVAQPASTTSIAPSQAHARVDTAPASEPSFLQQISNFQILIASLLVSSVFGFVMLTMRNRRDDSRVEPRTQPSRFTPETPATNQRMNFANVNGLRARETALGQKMNRWLIELSPEQLARLTREDIKFGIALCHVAGEDRATAVTAGMSSDLIEAVSQALLIWRFDQLEVFAGKFAEMVSHELARDPHEVTPMAHAPREASSEIVIETDADGDQSGLPPAEFLFSLPAEVLKASFMKMANSDKLGLVSNLEGDKRAEFIAVVAPFNSKLRDYIDLELEQIQKDPDRSEDVRLNRDAYLVALSRACRDLLESDEAFREQVLPLWTKWRDQRASGHAA